MCFGVTPKKISADLVNLLADSLRQEGALHDVGVDGRCDRINESETTREGKAF